MPRHINPTKAQRTATAPYNFVPLPESVFTASGAAPTVDAQTLRLWEHRDAFVPGTFSGWIDLEIETLTPLYIRGPVRQRNGKWDTPDARVRPQPYATVGGRPVIPGSTLRGAIRSLVEILSFAKIRPVTRSKPFFRDISPSRISAEYRKYFVEDLGQLSRGIDIAADEEVNVKAPGYAARVRAGFIDFQRRTIRECDFSRVEHRKITSAFPQGMLHDGNGPMATPSWTVQHQQCYVNVDSTPQDYFFKSQVTTTGDGRVRERHPDLYLRFRKVHRLSASPANGLIEGTLVFSGGVPRKHLEFVFLEPQSKRGIPVPDSIWQRFHDDDQISQWQERAFPRDRPERRSREQPGALRDGEPVFFLSDDIEKSEDNPEGLLFLGRAQLFRFPYDLSPNDIVPAKLRDGPLDLAEALFGCVASGKNSEEFTLKGRVYFEDGIANSGGPPWTEEMFAPRILSAPKPTAFQYYLTQDGTRSARELTTYLRTDSTTIRGHKLYWHRWDDDKRLDEAKEPEKQEERLKDLTQGQENRHKQHTVIQPVKPGLRFTSRIRFENVTDVELGALIAALDLPDQCAHKIGMGQPLGLGSVRIQTKLHVMDREERCRKWDTHGVADDDGKRFQDAFESTIMKHAEATDETFVAANQKLRGLRRIARLDVLFLMLEWEKRPRLDQTKSITDLNEFRKRPVLPTPHKVAGRPEPSWRSDPPCPDQPPRVGNNNSTDVTHQRQKITAQPRQVKTKVIQKGQTHPGRIVRVGDKWLASFDGDERNAQIVNPEQLPSSVTEGMRAEFYVVEQSKRVGIRVRFERSLT